MSRKKSILETEGPWHYALEGHDAASLPALRAETWRAMEDALAEGKVKAIGVGGMFLARRRQPITLHVTVCFCGR